jgi:hypothetical protein
MKLTPRPQCDCIPLRARALALMISAIVDCADLFNFESLLWVVFLRYHCGCIYINVHVGHDLVSLLCGVRVKGARAEPSRSAHVTSMDCHVIETRSHDTLKVVELLNRHRLVCLVLLTLTAPCILFDNTCTNPSKCSEDNYSCQVTHPTRRDRDIAPRSSALQLSQP